jgi:hypothetical protein
MAKHTTDGHPLICNQTLNIKFIQHMISVHSIQYIISTEKKEQNSNRAFYVFLYCTNKLLPYEKDSQILLLDSQKHVDVHTNNIRMTFYISSEG